MLKVMIETSMRKALVVVLVFAVTGVVVATHDARGQSRDFNFLAIESADLQVSSVDDLMSIYINGQKVEEARFGETPPRRSILQFLKRGPNAITVDIYNGKYGGCGGVLTVRLNLTVVLQRRWEVPMKDAPYEANCIREVLTLNLN
jgi:hypothetical protein